MSGVQTNLEKRIESGDRMVIAEISPPKGADAETVRARAKRYAGKTHAIAVSDNRDCVRMAALAAASLVAAEGLEPILHIVTRDRNRIALVSDCLGAQALGIRNLLCTSGTHQTLGPFRSARNVSDVDSVQLVQALSELGSNGSIVGEESFPEAGPFCLGGAASPVADPMELQVMRLAKKATAGAKFLVTQPVFDLERFEAWWNELQSRGIHEKLAVMAGIQPLGNAESAKAYAGKRPDPRVPDAIVERICGKASESEQQQESIKIAVETIEKLSGFDGLRGFAIQGDGNDEAALAVLEKAGLEIS
jgi:methylenetetrahydrofolate reductase (NADPH)